MKKFMSLLLCAVMVFGTASLAFANPSAPYGIPADGINMLNKYNDITYEDWFYNAFYYCEQYNVLDSTTDNTMSPDGTIDRKEFVSMLYRLECAPKVTGKSVFSDVEAGDIYGDAIIWAYNNKIVLGYDDGLFRPNDGITKEQAALVIYRYIQYKGECFTGDWMFLLPLDDASNISSWASEAVHWCYMKGIITGYNGKLYPKAIMTRAEAACIVQRTVKPDFDAPAPILPISETIDPINVGGWMINSEYGDVEIPTEAKSAFDKAIDGLDGVAYTPVAYLGSQVVAGTNYAFLCYTKPIVLNPTPSLKVVVIYKDLNGNASINDFYDIDVASYRDAKEFQFSEDNLAGGFDFTKAVGGVLDKAAKEAFEEVTKGLVGVKYTPIAELGSQVVAGINYAILCKVSSVTANPKTGVAVMVIYYDLSGNANITNLAQFVF